MQLNGTIMAASEPPEPPPRNPDKINASLKIGVANDTKSTKPVDTFDKPVNNNKPLKSLLSSDDTIGSIDELATTIETSLATTATNTINVNAEYSTVNGGNDKIDECIDNNRTNKSTNVILLKKDSTTTTMMSSSMTASTKNASPQSSSTTTAALIEFSSMEQQSQNNRDDQKMIIDRNNANDIDNNITSMINDRYYCNNENKINFKCMNNKDSLSMDVCDANRNDENGIVGRSNSFELSTQNQKLKQENERLTKEVTRLRQMLDQSQDFGAVGGIDLSEDTNSLDAQSTDGSSNRVDRMEAELKLAREHILHLKTERKKLKADKNDLLLHVKQLCASLQDKEQELRDFIRNFELRIRESESSSAKVSSDRERERWSLLKHARDESERSISLAAQLNARDIQLQRIQEQLQEARRQLSGCMSDQESLLSFAPLTPPSGMISQVAGPSSGFGSLSIGDRGSCSADSGVRGSSDKESAAGDFNLSDGPSDNGPCIQVDPDSVSLVSSHHNMYQFGTPKERSPTLSPLNSGAFSRSVDSGALSRSVEHLGSPVETEGPLISRKLHPKSSSGTLGSRSSRGGTWGSISRVFARTRHRNKNPQPDTETSDFQWNPLTEEGYAEKLRLLREASSIPIERWRASQVLAWLEVALGMPQYSSRCAENVKSGKVLLELNDSELESGLGLGHPMHRKKLRLAIEEQRRPELIRYPTIGQLGHTWVASEWLPDIGLSQYTESFLHSLVDARMLDTLSKKELEKFLSVTRKFHQASIVHGIHVLRILKYDRQALAMRRLQCENLDADPIVWTNQRFIRWARSIDLGEYADNLKDSGVHGGLVVLEPSFSGDTMATALGIPPSKNIIRRHLSTEFDTLVVPARAQLGQGIRTGGGTVIVPITGPGGLQQHTDRRTSGSLRFTAWRGSQGSLSKTFRLNNKTRPDRQFGSSTSPTPSYSSSESGMYATIGPPPPPTTAPPPPPSHRVSAPPMDTNSTLPRYAQHRRVKSISDIEVVAATPV